MPKRIIDRRATCYRTKDSNGDRALFGTSALLVGRVPGTRFPQCEIRLYIQTKSCV